MEESRSGGAPSRDQLRNTLKRAFDADHAVVTSRDRGRDLEAEIWAVLSTGSAVRSVECRSELCRIETVHPDLSEFQRYVGDAFAALDSRIGTGPVMASVLADPIPGQPVIAVAFVGREGTELPRPSPNASGDSR